MKCTAFECSVQAKTRCPVPVAGGGAPSRSSDSHTTALRGGRGQRSAAHFARLRLYRHVRGEVWVGRYDTPSAQDRTGLRRVTTEPTMSRARLPIVGPRTGNEP